MKINTTYDAKELNIAVHYDHQARRAFARAGKAADWFRQREVDGSSEEKWDATALAELDAGIDLLHRLGGQESRKLCFGPYQAWQGLDAVLITTLYCLDNRRSISDFKAAVMLLGGVTPVPVSMVSLPPATEVFDRSRSHPSTWAAYEAIRLWPHGGSPRLFMVEFCQLRDELAQLDNLPTGLTQLLGELTAVTGLFRHTVCRIEQAEKGNDSKRKMHK